MAAALALAAALPFAAVLALAAALAWIGSSLRGLLARPDDGFWFRGVIYFAAGAVAFHLVLTLAQGLGLAWSRASVVAALALLAAGGAALARGPLAAAAAAAGKTRMPSDWGWGDGVALAALLAFSLFALGSWVTTPDFIYHWGLKGVRAFLAGGIDFADLARSWNQAIHPDYPNLLPELYAASALLAGRFDAAAAMLWSILFFALLLAAAREVLARHTRAGASGFVCQAALAVAALAVAAFGIGSVMAGAADWLIALVLVAASGPLLREPSPVTDRQVAVLAALAAAAKIEGVPLAAFLIAVELVRAGKARLSLARVAVLVAPAAAVALPWLWEVRRHHLFQAFNSGPLDLGRWPAVGTTLLVTLSDPAWHGLAWGLLLLPALWLDRRVRTLGAVLALQLGFYLYVYLSVRIDAPVLILASFPRLLLHLLPAVAVGAVIAADRAAGSLGGEGGRSGGGKCGNEPWDHLRKVR